jgi:TRAP-type C4-dicarboxylate transport system permease small subunit
LNGCVGRLASLFNGIAAGAVVGMMTLTCLDVLLRFFRHPIPGTYEIVGMLGAVFVSFSLARTSVDQGHIAVDFLVQRLPKRLRYVVEAINAGICALLFTVVCRQCVIYALDLKDQR